MRRWVELATQNSESRFKLLQSELESIGIENEVSFIACSRDEFKDALDGAMNDYDLIRIGAGLGELVTQAFPHQSERVLILKTADCLFPIQKRWWSRSATYHGLQRNLSNVGSYLELDSKVLVVGAGAIARAGIAALVKMGFRKFSIANVDRSQVDALVTELSRSYFGVQFDFIPQEDLVMLTGDYGVAINTTPAIDKNLLLKELYYFNFLKIGGVVVDFMVEPRNSLLIQEARSVGAHTIEGYEIASWADAVWSKWCFGKSILRDSYNEKLCNVLPTCASIQSLEEGQSSENKLS